MERNVYIGVFEYGSSTDYTPKHVKSFNVWSDAEAYAKKYYNYPEGDCIIQFTRFH